MRTSHIALAMLVTLGPLACSEAEDDASGGAGGAGSPSQSGSTSTTAASMSNGSGTGGDLPMGGPLSNRPYDPLVIEGARLPGIASVRATDVVAFAFVEGAWKQIPVQVDERVLVDFCQIYAAETFEGLSPCGTTADIEALFYADPATYTGADTDPNVDADDEVVLMARDAAGRAPASGEPAGVVPGSGVEVVVGDGSETAYAYLFGRAEGSGLDPAAGIDLVHYDFALEGGLDYKTDYPFQGGGNCGGTICNPPVLEDSSVTTDRYRRHFAARWVTDALALTTEGSTGDDILDLAQDRFAPSFCGRHVLTFSTAEGAFVANVDGPLRAIRSYLGANSGPLTERTHLFYQASEEVQTFLRVHPIPSVMDLVDYSPTATGMTYFNSENTAGLAIDGAPDASFSTAMPSWELVTGPHGSVLSKLTHFFSGDFHASGYYEDDASTPNDQCDDSDTVDAPDAQAFGTSGVFVDQEIPATDPRIGGVDYVVLVNDQSYEPAAFSEADAEASVSRPAPTIEARRFTGGTSVCGDGACATGEATDCPVDCAPRDGSCGDGFCDLWENSVTCNDDCGNGQGPGGSTCGDASCAADENELTCADDCWAPAFVPVVACLDASCPVEKGACAAEAGCVDLVVCIGNCIVGGGNQSSCSASCQTSIAPTPQDSQLGQALLSCASSHGCN